MTDGDLPESLIRAEEDDPSIADGDYIYRRVARDPVNTKQEAWGIRASSAAFEDKEDGMSVFLHSVMAGQRLSIPWDVIDGKAPGTFVVARLLVGDLRALGCGVTRDPDPPAEPPHPCNPAHALVHLPPLGKRPLGRLRSKIAQLAELFDRTTAT